MAAIVAWLNSLDESTRLLILTVLGERLVQLLRWVLDKLHIGLPDSAWGKIGKICLALLTSLVFTLTTLSGEGIFWKEWLSLFATMTLLHELGGKTVRAYLEKQFSANTE